MPRLQHRTRGFGAPRLYIQGPGELENLKRYTDKFGASVYALIDTYFYRSLRSKYDELFSGDGGTVLCDEFKGEVTVEQTGRFTEAARGITPDVVVGVGGGRTIDAIRIVANNLGATSIIVPTLASTDAPVASLSAVFNDEGEQVGIKRFDYCPDVVLVDTAVIARAPVRYFVAGMGDAVATCSEAKLSASSDSPNLIGAGYRSTLAAMAICETCERTILTRGAAAALAVANGLCTPDVEDVVEASTLLSGLGYLNVGLCGAHATNTGLTVLPELRGAMHGELVAFGTLVQWIVEQKPIEELRSLYAFFREVGLPTTLKKLGVAEMTEEKLRRVAQKAVAGFWTHSPFLVTEQMVKDGIRMADAVGRRWDEE